MRPILKVVKVQKIAIMSKLILFNKPFQVLSQFTDATGRKTLADYVPVKGVYPCGRLDRDSEGLLLLTDDGKLQHHFSNPVAKVEKTYWVQVEGIPEESHLQQFRKGLLLKDGLTLPAKVQRIDPQSLWERIPSIRVRQSIPDTWLEVKIKEGKNRQVRRMTAAMGFPTLRLVRVAIGEHRLEQLKPGEWIEKHCEC